MMIYLKMHLSNFHFILILLNIAAAERLIVSGSSRSISASLGDDVTLSCSVDSHIKPEEIEEVSWRKRDKDEDILVLLYQNNETQSGSSDERYRDRVEFFTDEIHRGNFSLRLQRVTTEDKGVYICQVFNGELSANTTVILDRLGFSALHIMVLILCVTACGFALLFCFLIYCTSSKGFIVEGYFNQRGSVVLPCFVDPQFMRKGLKVKWSKSGLESPVCMYQYGDDTPEIEHQDYHDRVKFFTEFISYGNLSLLLKNLTAEDEGQYTCTVYRQQRPVFLVHMNLLQNEQEFTVEYSCDLVVFPRDSVVLPCFIDPSIMTEDLEVEWRRSDSQTLVNLYEVGNIRSEVQHQDYHDRAHFFTEDIQLGNFSLKLKNLTAEDEGQYTCEVKSGEHSVFLTSELVPRQIDRTAAKPFEPLGYIHMFLPNIIMFVAFVLWGLTEGYLYETIFCCALCLLRPLMLIYVAPYVKDISGAPVTTEFAILTIVYFSVFFRRSWETVVHFTWLDKAFVIVMFGLVLLISLIVMSRKFRFLDVIIILFLPVLQLTLMFFTFRAASRTGLFVIVLFPLILLLKFNCLIDIKQSKKRCINLLNIAAWTMLMFLMNALVIYFYVTSLEDDTDVTGWICTTVFLHLLWMISVFLGTIQDLDFSYRKILYVFGSVGVVLIIAVALMTELILKTVNGDRTLGDLRIVVYSSESLFTLTVLSFLMFQPWITKFPHTYQHLERCYDIPVDTEQQNQDPQNAQLTDLGEQHEEGNNTEPDAVILQPEDHEDGNDDSVILQPGDHEDGNDSGPDAVISQHEDHEDGNHSGPNAVIMQPEDHEDGNDDSVILQPGDHEDGNHSGHDAVISQSEDHENGNHSGPQAVILQPENPEEGNNFRPDDETPE